MWATRIARCRIQQPGIESFFDCGWRKCGACELKKQKILGARCHGIMMPDTIQPREYSMGSGLGDIVHATDSNGNPNGFYVKRKNDGKRWLNTNWVNPDNRWNLDNELVFVLRNSLHFSLVRPAASGGVCFCNCPCQPPSILPTSSS